MEGNLNGNWENRLTWECRLASLKGTIGRLIENLDRTAPLFWDDDELTHGNQTMDASKDTAKVAFLRKRTFARLLGCLLNFAEDQARFFLDGFVNGFPDPIDPENVPLTKEESEDFPPDHVMSVTLDQISYDLAVIQRAISQRVLASPEEVRTLITTDWLASEALKQASDNNLIEKDIYAITYFQKEASIRVIPYAGVALIAVPFTAVETPQDYLAIPHEVGHYVFWRYVDFDENPLVEMFDATRGYEGLLYPFDRKLPLRKSIVYNWQEELFADVFGCLTAGPAIALSFQDLQLEKEKGLFDRDDGVHPAPIIRPRVYTETLRKTEDPIWVAWADKLDTQWDQQRTKRGKNRDEFETVGDLEKYLLKAWSLDKNIRGGELNRQLIRGNVDQVSLGPQTIDREEFNELDQVIDVIYNCLSVIKSDVSPWLNLDEVNSLAEIAGLEENKIYEGFEENINTFKKDEEISNLQNDLDKYDNPEIEGGSVLADYSKMEAETLCISGLQQKWHKIGKGKGSNPTWRHVLKADGWATKGPDGRFDPE